MSEEYETPPGQTAGLAEVTSVSTDVRDIALKNHGLQAEISANSPIYDAKLAASPKADPRIYRVRRSRDDDSPMLACGAVTTAYCLTLWRIDGATRIISEPRVGAFAPWRDNDEWCTRAWRAIEDGDREFLRERPPGNPWGDALRQMRESGPEVRP